MINAQLALGFLHGRQFLSVLLFETVDVEAKSVEKELRS